MLLFLWASFAAPHARVQGSLQGLYTLGAGSGQLRRLDWLNGSHVDVGAPLEAVGLEVASCAASLVQQTNKWYFTLATNTSKPHPHKQHHTPQQQAPGSDATAAAEAVHLVGMALDGSGVTYFQTLPADIFPPSAGLAPCDYTLDVDGGLVIFVSAVVGDRLLTVKFAHSSSETRMSGTEATGLAHDVLTRRGATVDDADIAVVVNASVAALGLGPRPRFPSSTMLPTGDFWYQFEHGVACHNVADGGKFVKKVSVPTATTSAYGGLTYSLVSDLVHGVWADATSSPPAWHVLWFDPQADEPIPLHVGNETIGGPVDRDGAALTVLSDHKQLAVLSNGRLLTLECTTGHRVATVDLCSDTSMAGAGGSDTCPASIGYLPYVF